MAAPTVASLLAWILVISLSLPYWRTAALTNHASCKPEAPQRCCNWPVARRCAVAGSALQLLRSLPCDLRARRGSALLRTIAASGTGGNNEDQRHHPVAARAHGGHGRRRRRSGGRLVVGPCAGGGAADRTGRADALPLQARRVRGHDHLRWRGSGGRTAPDLRRERVRRRGAGARRAEFPAARQDGDRLRAGGRQHGQGAGPVRYRQRRRAPARCGQAREPAWPPPGSSRSRSTSWC